METPELEVPDCGVCGGSTWLYMRLLGSKAHLRCRDCGTETSVDVFEDDTESED